MLAKKELVCVGKATALVVFLVNDSLNDILNQKENNLYQNNAFTKFFKQITGISPSKFLEIYTSKSIKKRINSTPNKNPQSPPVRYGKQV